MMEELLWLVYNCQSCKEKIEKDDVGIFCGLCVQCIYMCTQTGWPYIRSGIIKVVVQCEWSNTRLHNHISWPSTHVSCHLYGMYGFLLYFCSNLTVKGSDMYIPPLTGKPKQRLFTIWSGLVTSTSSRRCIPLPKQMDFGSAVAAWQTQLCLSQLHCGLNPTMFSGNDSLF